jgi:hypothetical protein
MKLIECMVPGEPSVFKRFRAILMKIVMVGSNNSLMSFLMNYSLLVLALVPFHILSLTINLILSLRNTVHRSKLLPLG